MTRSPCPKGHARTSPLTAAHIPSRARPRYAAHTTSPAPIVKSISV